MDNNINAIFIHGAGGSAEHWYPILKYLSPSISPIFFELPGHGKRSGIIPSTMYEVLYDFEIFIAKKRIKRFHLIGHSLGGLLALFFVIKKPNMVNKLILISSAANILIHPEFLYQIKNRQLDFSFIELGLASSISQDMKKIIRKNLVKIRIKNDSDDFMGCSKLNLKNELKKINKKTLVIFGEQDKIISPRRSKELGKLIFGSIIKVISDAKHYPHLEKTNEVANHINNFIMENN